MSTGPPDSTTSAGQDKNQELDTMTDDLSPDINMHPTTTSNTATISNIGAGGEQQVTENGNGDLFMGDDDSEDKNWKPNLTKPAMDEIEDGIGNEAKTRWDRIEPSPTNLNKLDGWLKKGHSNREDDYHAPVDFNDRGQGKKPRVRWLDVETHLEINHHRRESTN